VPEGENKHSQSVVDLFEFIREAAQVVLSDLPLSEYRRAVYLVDLSKVSLTCLAYVYPTRHRCGKSQMPDTRRGGTQSFSREPAETRLYQPLRHNMPEQSPRSLERI